MEFSHYDYVPNELADKVMPRTRPLTVNLSTPKKKHNPLPGPVRCSARFPFYPELPRGTSVRSLAKASFESGRKERFVPKILRAYWTTGPRP